MGNKTSKYRGVYFNSTSSKWVVELERHHNFPCFTNEHDAGIYAEYYYRKLYGTSPNFPALDDHSLEKEHSGEIARRDGDRKRSRSASKQGLKKCKMKTSKYVGVFQSDGTRWVARIQYRASQYIFAPLIKTSPELKK